jgi:hypothetical protein
MSEGSITDVMIKVGNLFVAIRALENLGMRQEAQGDGWALLEHLASNLKIVLTDQDFGSPCALSIRARDLAALSEQLNTCGWTPDSNSSSSSATHITLRHSAGLVAVAYKM